MNKVILFIVFSSICFMFYRFGHNSAALSYAQTYNEKLDTMNKAYIARFEQLNQLNSELNEQIKRYESDNISLVNTTNNLRMQLTSAFKGSSSCTIDKSVVASELSDRRNRTLETVINGATDIIEERDKIALAYNELRKQCQLK